MWRDGEPVTGAQAMHAVVVAGIRGTRRLVAAFAMKAYDARAGVPELLSVAVAERLHAPPENQGEEQEAGGPRAKVSADRTSHRSQAIRPPKA